MITMEWTSFALLIVAIVVVVGVAAVMIADTYYNNKIQTYRKTLERYDAINILVWDWNAKEEMNGDDYKVDWHLNHPEEPYIERESFIEPLFQDSAHHTYRIRLKLPRHIIANTGVYATMRTMLLDMHEEANKTQ